ncbi:MAG: hypothetical protein O2958_02210 [Gemmatimonadetes bacterium]|nr:hypothetical protein [Gemmatimonadota bacterium]MDA1102079.1 hypothetical protein [Gemmatimonadota bacterium]
MLLRADVFSALAVTVGFGLTIHAGADVRSASSSDETSSHAVSFADQIAPILEARCSECHSAESSELGLRLDSYEGVMAGSDYGTVVEAGDPDGSLLIEMIESGDMPEDGDPVPADEIELIRTWIAEGAENN